MPKFLYTAKSLESGEATSGEANAKDEHSLASDLRSQGLLVTSVKEVKEKAAVQIRFLDRFMSVPLKEKMLFTRNLAVMISSGLVVSRAIQSLGLQTKNPTLKKILASVYDEVQAGNMLSESLAKYPSVFGELFTSMVYVGEVSGNLESVLGILAVQLEKEHELKSKVKGALTYPAVILVAMVGIGILMLTYILPQITSVFQDMEVTLPKMTLMIIALSDFLRENALLSLFLVIVLAIGLKLLYGTPGGRRFFHMLFLRLPIVGGIVIKVNCARFARIYSSLLKSGVAVVDGLKIVSKTLTNVYYRDVLGQGIEDIQKGQDLSKTIAANESIFPILVSQILEVGEETGKTDLVLEKLAQFYEDEVSQITSNLSSILEPVLMLLIGGAVGFFAVAMLQPMYSVLENIN
jgi:type IV pilus assembly protein PilC